MQPTAATPDPIQHVVVLMLENRSFDRMLGALLSVYPGLDGVDPAAPRSNPDRFGQPVPQAPTTATVVKPDPKHELVNVLRQLEGDNGGFVRDYALEYPGATAGQLQEVMGYHPLDFLPALHALARDFTVCDHWFSSVPGPTWANRFFVHSGTSLGRVLMPQGVFNRNLHWYDQFTVYDRLNERGVPWKVYFHDFPLSWILAHQLEAKNAARYDYVDRFFADAAGDAAAFPAYSFIEPKYFWPRQNDDHPPHDTMRAQELIAQVYNALRRNPALWSSTLLVVLYDEHGGFFDHVPPPPAVPPDGHTEEYTFDRLGVRVPALLVSPWVERGVLSTVLDHTSLLRYLADKWQLGPLTARVAHASSFAAAIRTTGAPRTDTVESLSLPVGLRFEAALESLAEDVDSLNENQHALVSFSQSLEAGIRDDPETKVRRVLAAMEGSQAQFRVAQERVKLFLEQQKALAAVANLSAAGQGGVFPGASPGAPP